MALIKCPECGKEISDKAMSCPYCGNPMNQGKADSTTSIVIVQKDYKAKSKAFIIAGIIVFVIAAIVGLATVDTLLRYKAQYIMHGTGPYSILSFLTEAIPWVGIILIGIGIIYRIIYHANKKN